MFEYLSIFLGLCVLVLAVYAFRKKLKSEAATEVTKVTSSVESTVATEATKVEQNLEKK